MMVVVVCVQNVGWVGEPRPVRSCAGDVFRRSQLAIRQTGGHSDPRLDRSQLPHKRRQVLHLTAYFDCKLMLTKKICQFEFLVMVFGVIKAVFNALWSFLIGSICMFCDFQMSGIHYFISVIFSNIISLVCSCHCGYCWNKLMSCHRFRHQRTSILGLCSFCQESVGD